MKIMNILYIIGVFFQIFVLSEIPTILPTSFFFRTTSPTNNPRGKPWGVCLAAFGEGISKAADGAVAAFGSRSGHLQTPPDGSWEGVGSVVIFRWMGVVLFKVGKS